MPVYEEENVDLSDKKVRQNTTKQYSFCTNHFAVAKTMMDNDQSSHVLLSSSFFPTNE